MKKYFVLLACATFLGQELHANSFIGNQTLSDKTFEEVSILGSGKLTNVKADSLSIIGPLEFHNLMVKGDTNIAGTIEKSKKGKFGSLNVTGTFEASDVTCDQFVAAAAVTAAGLTVSGDATIVGTLTLKAPKDPKASQNKLKNLTVSAQEISLENTTVEGNIIVKKLLQNKPQVLRLTGNTTIKGTITFESGKGEIEQVGSAVIEGKVTGATVQKK